jgi:tRNA-binding protein
VVDTQCAERYRRTMDTPTPSDLARLGLRVGTVVRAEPNTGATSAAMCLWIDVGTGEPVPSSARITDRYDPASIVGTQVVVVTGFDPIRVGGFRSDVLVLGALDADGVVLVRPDVFVPPGAVIA